MNTRVTVAAVFVLGVGGFLVTNCSGDHSENEVVTAGGNTAIAPTTYPFDWCLVTGEELSCKDKSVTQVYKGQLLEFCCKQCLKVFKDDPRYYLDRLKWGRPEHDGESAQERSRIWDFGTGLLGW